jgi:predicted nuclease of predicted toxin-antitoxin system
LVAVRLYLDENVDPVVAKQLRQRGIDALCARDIGALGETDPQQLQRAIDMGRAIVTADVDFLILASQIDSHTGIIFGNQQTHSIGDWVTALETLCLVYEPNDMLNHVEFL